MTFMNKDKAIAVAAKNNQDAEGDIDAFSFLAEAVKGNTQGLWKVTVWDNAGDNLGTL